VHAAAVPAVFRGFLVSPSWFNLTTDYTRIVLTGKLLRIGDSAGVVIPSHLRRQLGWWQNDQIQFEATEQGLLLRNLTQRLVRPIKIDKVRDDDRRA
jgi:antitoxin component of MazEF toxin-antitoxin module